MDVCVYVHACATNTIIQWWPVRIVDIKLIIDHHLLPHPVWPLRQIQHPFV